MSNVHALRSDLRAVNARLYRRQAARLARDIRAMWPGPEGEWTRRDWNQQALASAYNYIARMQRAERKTMKEKQA